MARMGCIVVQASSGPDRQSYAAKVEDRTPLRSALDLIASLPFDAGEMVFYWVSTSDDPGAARLEPKPRKVGRLRVPT